jgi:hypothetical protein
MIIYTLDESFPAEYYIIKQLYIMALIRKNYQGEYRFF